MALYCAGCGAPRRERARFCHRCGTPRGEAGRAPSPNAGAAGAATTTAAFLPWIVAAIALLSFLAFVVRHDWRRPQQAPMRTASGAPAAASSGAGRPPDISQMSPQERADRLFNRVMTYVDQGKSDSAAFFAPMAIQSIETLAPLDAHQRYDLGLLGVVSGNSALARAQSDTILRAQPSHLLGLILGMRAAGLQLDTLGRRRYADRFIAALVAERAKRLPEYDDHAPDIDAAAREADARAPFRP